MKRSPTTRTGKRSLFPAALFNRRAAAMLAAGALLLSSHATFADSIWNAGTADFNTAADWTPNGIPNAVNIQVNNGGTVQITTNETTNDILEGFGGTLGGNYMQTAGTVNTNNGWIRLGISAGTGGTAANTYAISGGTIVGGGATTIGEIGNASMTLSNAASVTRSNFTSIGQAGGTGILTLLNTSAYNSGSTMAVGERSGATLNVEDTATLNVAGHALEVGGNGDGTGTLHATGTLNINDISGTGAIVNAGTLVVGIGANGTIVDTGVVNQANGTTTVTGLANLGNSLGATGTLNLSGGVMNFNLASVASLIVGGNAGTGAGKGTVTQTGGTVSTSATAGQLWVGENAGSVGIYGISGGALNVNSWIAIGRNSGTGTLNISGTGIVTKTSGTGNISLGGLSTTQTNTIAMTGGTLNNLLSGTWIGENGIANFNISAGTANLGGTGGYLDIDRTSATSTVNLSGTGLINTNQVQKSGGTGTGTFNFNGGTLQAAKTNATYMQGLTAANVLAGGANIDTNGFAITVAQPLLHGGTGTDGGLTLNDSTAAPGGTLILTGANTYNGATTITNGTLQLGNGTTDGNILSTSGVTDNSALIYNLLANRTVGYAISGTGSVTLNDTGATKGTLILANANTYTGATTQTAGQIILDHSGANTGALSNTAVTVGGGQTMLVKGNTNAGGSVTLIGGATPTGQGTLSLQDATLNTVGITNGLTLGGGGNGAILSFDLGTASGLNDVLNVGGAVTTSGTTTINLNALGSIASGASTYTLINATGGGLTPGGGGFVLGSKPAGFNTFSLTSSTTTQEILSISANATVVGNEYWTGKASSTGSPTDPANNWGYGATLATPKSNWSTNLAGTVDPLQVPGATTDVIFTATNATPVAGALNTQLDGAYNIKGLSFDTSVATAGITSVLIATGANTLTLGVDGLTVAATDNSTSTISGTGGIILGSSQNFANNSASALTIGNSITGAAPSGTNTLSFVGTGAGAVTLGGTIADGSLGGKLGLVVSKTGTGTLTLNGASTFTGGTTLNSGTVVLGSTTALGAPANALTFGAGSTGDLQLNGNSIATGGLITNATVGTPIIENVNAANVTLNNTVTALTGTATYGGVLRDGTGGGTLALAETGAGIQVLSGANIYSGGTTINAAGGGLTLGAGGTLGAATGNTTVTAGTLDLGGQTVSQNSLTLNGGNVVGPTGTLNLGSTGTAVLINSGVYTFASPAETANLILNGGNIIKSANTGNPNISGNIVLNGNNSVAAVDTSGDLFPELTLSGIVSGTGTLTQDNTVGGFTIQENGVLLLANANTYTGGTNITYGRTEIANSNALGTGAVTVGAHGTLALGGGQVQNVVGTPLTVANNITLNHTVAGNYGQDAIQNNFGANTLTGAITLAANSQFNVFGGSLSQSGAMSGTGALIKIGNGTLTLNGANTYAGVTTITAGTLQVGTGGTTGSLGTNAGVITNNGTLTYNRSDTVILPNVITGTGALVNIGTGTLDLTGIGSTETSTTIHAGAITVDNGAGLTNTGAVTVGGAAGDNGTLNVQGTGALTAGYLAVAATGNAVGTVNQTGGTVTLTSNFDTRIGGNNGTGDAASVGTYNLSGGTLTAAGNLQVGAYGHGNLIQTGGTLNSASYTDSGRFVGGVGLIDVEGGNFNQTGAGKFLIDGELGTGVITVGTTGTVTSAGAVVMGLTAGSSGTFNLNTGGTLNTPFISGGGAAGTTALGTTVFKFNGGTLTASASNANFVAGITTNVLTGGAVVNTNGNNDTIATVLNGSAGDGGLTKTGLGTLTLTKASTYTGATTITAGTLQVGSGGATPTGSIASTGSITVGGGTTLITANNGALSNATTAVNLGDGNGSATVQNGAFTTATAANNIQQAGALSLGQGTANILDFNNLFGTYDFSSASGPGFSTTGTSLNLRNFGVAANESTLGGNYQLLFDTALTTAQLADISFLNSDNSQFGAIQQATGVGSQVQILEGTSPAPEPAQTAALGLFGLGLGALVLKARKRKANSMAV